MKKTKVIMIVIGILLILGFVGFVIKSKNTQASQVNVTQATDAPTETDSAETDSAQVSTAKPALESECFEN